MDEPTASRYRRNDKITDCGILSRSDSRTRARFANQRFNATRLNDGNELQPAFSTASQPPFSISFANSAALALFAVSLAAISLSTQAQTALEPVDQSCTRTYNAQRGVMPRDCYPREEVARFVCLSPKIAPISPACSKSDAHFPIAVFNRFGDTPNTNIFTVGGAKGTTALNLERDAKGYSVGYVLTNAKLNDPLDPAVPDWIKPDRNKDIAQGTFIQRVALQSCQVTQNASGCTDHVSRINSLYKAGGNLILGGVAQKVGPNGNLVSAGKYLYLSIGSDAHAAVNITDEFGASRLGFIGGNKTTIITDNLAKWLDKKPQSAAVEPNNPRTK